MSQVEIQVQVQTTLEENFITNKNDTLFLIRSSLKRYSSNLYFIIKKYEI